MEQASESLVKRRYFEAEKLCMDALRSAISGEDYERAARICLPLQEARRLKRQLAIDSGRIEVVSEGLGEGYVFKPGCYIVCPPRVGAEARAIRQLADEQQVPVITFAREPTTRAGLCPLVAVGPVTVRAFIDEPPPVTQPKPRKGAKQTQPLALPAVKGLFGVYVPPPIEWIVAASEALGDAAIAQVTSPVAADRVDDLFARLQSCPDHEKLHQRLMEACEQATREPKRKRATPALIDEEEDEFGEGAANANDE